MSVLTNNFDLAILHLLVENDNYGYKLVEMLNKKFKEDVKEISIYSVIKRLNKDSYLEGYSGVTSEGAKRKYYKVTESGIKYYNKLLDNYNSEVVVFNDFLKENNEQ